MYDRIKRVAGPAAILGGIIWAVIPLIATHAAMVLQGTILGVLLLALASGGVHILYREIRKGFYEEIGFGVLLLGFFATIVSIGTYSPANTETLIGLILSSIPIAVAVGLLMVGSAVLGFASLTSKSLPMWASSLLLVAIPADLVAYYLQVSTVGLGISLYGIFWCVIGIVLVRIEQAS